MGSSNANENQHSLLDSCAKDVDEATKRGCMDYFKEKTLRPFVDLRDFVSRTMDMGRNDPQKVMFAIKAGLALAIVSLLICWKGMRSDVAQYSIWAILTVIVMFEYTIGATFIKGFNRVLGTISAGILAFCSAELSLWVGKWEEGVIVASIFVIGFCAFYLKLYPTMKPYEYGFRVFILTYCILMVAGNRTREYTEAVITRLVLIAVGAGVCFAVNLCIYPIWAGDALHDLVVKNFKDVALSLEGCISGYLNWVEFERVPSYILSFQAYDDPMYNGYRSVVESTSKEDTLLGFAIWEPPHGRFKMLNYPWRHYVKLSDALRHCAFAIMALHGCILSEIQAPAERRQVFSNELQRVGAEGAKVLHKLGEKAKRMERIGNADILKRVHEAADQLQKKIDEKSYLLINSERWEITSQELTTNNISILKDNAKFYLGTKSLSETVLDIKSVYIQMFPSSASDENSDNLFRKLTSWPSRLSIGSDPGIKEEGQCRTYESASALSLATFASLLIEFVARLQNVVDTFEELSEKAKFSDN